MDEVYVAILTVPESAIDANRHVNNLAYLHWMQSVSIEHGLSSGFGLKQLMKAGGSWAICSNSIDYLRPSFGQDDLAIFSWIGRLGEKSFQRHFLFYRSSDHAVLAKAVTTFVYIDMDTGKAKPIPDDVRKKLNAVDEARNELLRALQDENRQAPLILDAISSGHPLSQQAVGSFAVDRALTFRSQRKE